MHNAYFDLRRFFCGLKILLLGLSEVCLNDVVEDKNKQFGWATAVGWGLGAVAVVMLMLFLWVTGRGILYLNRDIYEASQDGSEVRAYLIDEGLIPVESGYSSYRGMVLGNFGCLSILYEGKYECVDLDETGSLSVFLVDRENLTGRPNILSMMSGGLVENVEVDLTDTVVARAIVSSESLDIGSFKKALRYGDIVQVVGSAETGKVLGVIIVSVGGVI